MQGTAKYDSRSIAPKSGKALFHILERTTQDGVVLVQTSTLCWLIEGHFLFAVSKVKVELKHRRKKMHLHSLHLMPQLNVNVQHNSHFPKGETAFFATEAKNSAGIA